MQCVLFDEAKLKKALSFSNSHIDGHASNNPEELAIAVLVVEMVFCHGGLRFAFSNRSGHKIKYL